MAQRVLSHSNYNVIIAMPCKIKMLESTHFIIEGLNMTELRQRFIEDLQLQGKSEGVPTGVPGGPDIFSLDNPSHITDKKRVPGCSIQIMCRKTPHESLFR